MKKFFRFLVSALLFSASSALANTTNVNGVVYTYTVSDGKASIYKGDWDAAISILTSGALAIPVTLGGYPVTSIGDYAFFCCNTLTAVTIPENVTSIGAYAFYCCGGLTSAPIPSGVTSIGDWAFFGCSALTSVTIPVGVTSISLSAFSACDGLTNMNISATNPNYSSIGGVLYNKDQTALLLCPGGLTSLTIPSGVTSIGDSAFSGCSGLTSVTIPASVTSIGDSAFSGCSGLTSVTIPPCVDSLSSIFPEAYQNITNVIFVGTAIGSSVCDGQSSLKTITIAESVTGIGEYAFSGCSGLTSVTIPASVTSIGDSAFSGCLSLKNVFFAGKAPVFGKEVFLSASPVLNVQSGTAGWDEAGAGLSINVEDGGAAVAGVALSAAWLTRQGLVSEGADTAAMKAAAEQVWANGLPAWKSFVAGLEPTNSASQFTTEITFTNGAPFVSWTPDLGGEREYAVRGLTNLTDTAWVTPTNSATRFYKVEVRLR